ncbi:hypothetical protein GCM10027074_74830 [Streptomyces deserti]
MFTAPWKPVSHWLVTEYSTVHAGPAADAETTGTTAVPSRAAAAATAKSTERGGCRMSESLQFRRVVTDASTDGTAPTGVNEASAK